MQTDTCFPSPLPHRTKLDSILEERSKLYENADLKISLEGYCEDAEKGAPSAVGYKCEEDGGSFCSACLSDVDWQAAGPVSRKPSVAVQSMLIH